MEDEELLSYAKTTYLGINSPAREYITNVNFWDKLLQVSCNISEPIEATTLWKFI